jgi:hypothetical protein
MPPERKAALRAVALEKSADRYAGSDRPGDRPTNDPLELTKRALRRPLSLAQIEKLANTG